MAAIFDQTELFPSATIDEIRKTKELLSNYQKYKRTVLTLQGEDLTPNQQKALRDSRRNMIEIERAVNLILDPEVREVVRYRYIEGHSYTATVAHFARMMDDRTVDRKLNKGIESVAEALKLL